MALNINQYDLDLLLIITTESNLHNAKRLARIIMEKNISACINFSNINSIYWWEGKLQETSEVQLLIKTKPELKDEVFKTIVNEHTYKIPELISFKVSSSQEYNQWIRNNIS